jgi:hypothetical protein
VVSVVHARLIDVRRPFQEIGPGLDDQYGTTQRAPELERQAAAVEPAPDHDGIK